MQRHTLRAVGLRSFGQAVRSAANPLRKPQSSANAARGGLDPPPAGRLRRAYLHHPNSTNYSTVRSPTYTSDPFHCSGHTPVAKSSYTRLTSSNAPVDRLAPRVVRGRGVDRLTRPNPRPPGHPPPPLQAPP